MTKSKKILLTTAGVIDVALTVFFFVISVIMISRSMSMTAAEIKDPANTGLIGYLQNHTTVYLVGFVLPLFVLLGLNITALVLYVKKTEKKETIGVNDLTEAQKEALKAELMKDLQKGK